MIKKAAKNRPQPTAARWFSFLAIVIVGGFLGTATMAQDPVGNARQEQQINILGKNPDHPDQVFLKSYQLRDPRSGPTAMNVIDMVIDIKSSERDKLSLPEINLANMEVDHFSGRFLVLADALGHEVVKQTLSVIDEPKLVFSGADPNITLEVAVIMNAPDAPAGTALSEQIPEEFLDVERITEVVQDWQRPLLVARVGTMVSPRIITAGIPVVVPENSSKFDESSQGLFRAEGSGPNDFVRLKMSGTLAADGEEFLLKSQFEIGVLSAGPESARDDLQLSTEVKLQRHRTVLLALTSIKGQSCLLVLTLR